MREKLQVGNDQGRDHRLSGNGAAGFGRFFHGDESLLVVVADLGGTIGVVVAAAFFLVFIGVAFVAFKALKKTVKMAFRMAVVSVILVIAIIGSVSLWYFSGGGSPKLKPPATRSR